MRATLAALLRSLAQALAPTPDAPQQTALHKLPPVYAAQKWGRALTDVQIAALRQVPGENAWVGYDNGGFDWPSDVKRAGAINLQLTPDEWDGLLDWYSAESMPDVLWVLVYSDPDDLKWGGDPPGTHPSGGAFVVDAGAWLGAVGE